MFAYSVSRWSPGQQPRNKEAPEQLVSTGVTTHQDVPVAGSARSGRPRQATLGQTALSGDWEGCGPGGIGLQAPQDTALGPGQDIYKVKPAHWPACFEVTSGATRQPAWFVSEPRETRGRGDLVAASHRSRSGQDAMAHGAWKSLASLVGHGVSELCPSPKTTAASHGDSGQLAPGGPGGRGQPGPAC